MLGKFFKKRYNDIGDSMRVAVFSDIHGNVRALQAILEDIHQDSFDAIYYLGDAIGLGPKPKECLELLKSSGVEMILGNHELYYLHGTAIDDTIDSTQMTHYQYIKSIVGEEWREYLKQCPLWIEQKWHGKTFLFQHFFQKKEHSSYPFQNLGVIHQDVESLLHHDYTFIGHQHQAFTLEGEKMLIDVGSSGCTKEQETSYTILSIDSTISVEKKTVPYDRQKLIEDFQERDYPNRNFIAKTFFGISLD